MVAGRVGTYLFFWKYCDQLIEVVAGQDNKTHSKEKMILFSVQDHDVFGTDENDDDSMDSISIALSSSRKRKILISAGSFTADPNQAHSKTDVLRERSL